MLVCVTLSLPSSSSSLIAYGPPSYVEGVLHSRTTSLSRDHSNSEYINRHGGCVNSVLTIITLRQITNCHHSDSTCAAVVFMKAQEPVAMQIAYEMCCHPAHCRVPCPGLSLQVGVGSWQLNFVSFPSNFRALSSQKLLLLLLYKIKAAERGPSLSSQQFAIVIRQSCPRSELSKSRPLPH